MQFFFLGGGKESMLPTKSGKEKGGKQILVEAYHLVIPRATGNKKNPFILIRQNSILFSANSFIVKIFMHRYKNVPFSCLCTQGWDTHCPLDNLKIHTKKPEPVIQLELMQRYM